MATETEQEFQVAADAAGVRAAEWMREQLDALEAARTKADGGGEEDEARDQIENSALSVQVRDGWRQPGPMTPRFIEGGPEEYEILISTGGPASRIIGKLGEHCEVDSAEFQFQDWFKPWTTADLSEAEAATVLEWAQTFYFGE
jgi:hypothetical protein